MSHSRREGNAQHGAAEAHLRRSRGLSLIAALALLPIAGCTVGPDFEKPAPPNVDSYTARPLPATTASADVAGGTGGRSFIPSR